MEAGKLMAGHTQGISGLALSFDGALLATASDDDTIKLWAFEYRQFLASFDLMRHTPEFPLLTDGAKDHRICICNSPPSVLTQALSGPCMQSLQKSSFCVLIFPLQSIAHKKQGIGDLLNSDATRRPAAGHRRPRISVLPMVQRPLPTIDPQQPIFVCLSKLLHLSRTNPAHPVQNGQPRHPLHFPTTLPLPSSLSGWTAAQFDHRLATARLPEYKKVDDARHPSSQQATMPQENDTSNVDLLLDVHWYKAFLCYCSCWSHGRPRMPPRWRLEHVDISRQDATTNGSCNGVNVRSSLSPCLLYDISSVGP
ncbi:hypothetical protein P692DRAFT_201869156 [Suillus brevipes Sb2]|nr:hypothetical protein P692DRAFT_201869156 [Suillus brevipes Sb2]